MKCFVPMLLLFAPALHAQEPCPAYPSHIAFSTGTFSPMPGVEFHLRHFIATLENRGKNAPACYLKTTLLSRGEIFADNASITRIFSARLDGKSNVQDLQVENGLNKVLLKGRIVKIIPLHFTLEGQVSTDGTDLILTVTKVKADGIPVKSLMSMLGQHLQEVLGLHDVQGITVTDTQMRFSPRAIAHLEGHIQSAQSTASGLLLMYGPARPHAAKHTAR